MKQPTPSAGKDRGECQLRRIRYALSAAVCVEGKKSVHRQFVFILCAGLLFSTGCQQDSSLVSYSEEDAKAQRDELLKRFPAPPPDAPEQIRQKEATVSEKLPRVYELLELAKSDTGKTDEAVELSMSLVALLPTHREAIVAYCRAQLASFFAKEATKEGGGMVDQHNMAIAIRSGASEIDRLRKDFQDLSEEEIKLCQEIYFHRARLEGFYPHGSDTAEMFRDTIGKLMSSGFSDLERLKSEPRFQYFFTNPKFSPVLEAAIAQLEKSANVSPGTGQSEGQGSAKQE